MVSDQNWTISFSLQAEAALNEEHFLSFKADISFCKHGLLLHLANEMLCYLLHVTLYIGASRLKYIWLEAKVALQ